MHLSGRIWNGTSNGDTRIWNGTSNGDTREICEMTIFRRRALTHDKDGLRHNLCYVVPDIAGALCRHAKEAPFHDFC